MTPNTLSEPADGRSEPPAGDEHGEPWAEAYGVSGSPLALAPALASSTSTRPAGTTGRFAAWRARRAAARRARVTAYVVDVAQGASRALSVSPPVAAARRASAALLVAAGAVLGAVAALALVIACRSLTGTG